MPKFIDYTGQTIGNYAVVSRAPSAEGKTRRRTQFVFKCLSGHRFTASIIDVRNGHRTCRECRVNFGRYADLTGQQFGRLTVEGIVGSRRNKHLWKSQCGECNQTFEHTSDKIKAIDICPCRKVHGQCGTREYRTWQGMMARCYTPGATSWPHYGARGIRVCDRWHSFDNFLADMGPRPEGTSLDRIDGDGHYEPGNCRWATRKEQRRNMKQNTMLTWRGETRPFAEWADIVGMPRTLLRSRVRCGWDAEKILTTPPGALTGKWDRKNR